MDVRLPNGKLIQGIPEGTPKAAIQEKAIASGLATVADFDQTSQAPSANENENRPEISGGRGIAGQRSRQRLYDYDQEIKATIPEFKGNWTELDEIGAAPELNELSGAGMKASLGASLIGSDAEMAQMLQTQFPGTKITRDDQTNLIATLPSGGSYYINAPGFSGQDAMKFLTRAGLFALTGGTPTGMGLKELAKLGVASAATEAGAQKAEESVGGEFNKGEIALAGALSPVGQVVGQKVIAPAVSGVPKTLKYALRGGEESRQKLAASLADFAEMGDVPTAGTAGARTIGIENQFSKLFGGNPLRQAFKTTQDRMQKRLTEIADDISPVRGEVEAGRTIEQGIRGDGGFINRFTDKSEQLWERFNRTIGNQQVNLSRTSNVLDDVVSTTKVGEVLNNPLLVRVKGALDDSNGVVAFEEAKALRSEIGRRIADGQLISDIPRSQLKRIYGALSNDLEQLAANTGQDASRAFKRANNFTRSGHNRIDAFVQRTVKKDDLNKVFDAMARGGEGVQALNAMKRSLKPNEWEAVASNVIRRLGKSTPGQQDAAGEAFSVNKFLTDWNKLGPGKKVLFSGSRTLNDYSKNLDKIARSAQAVKEGAKEMANPSGTAQSVQNMGAMATAAAGIATGNFVPVTAVMAGIASINGASRLMSSPAFVKWLAQGTTTKNWPAHVARLTSLAEQTGYKQDVLDLVEILASPDITNDSGAGVPGGQASQSQ